MKKDDFEKLEKLEKIFYLCSIGNLTKVQKYLKEDINLINLTDEFGYSLLIQSVIKSQAHIASYLIGSGIDLNIKGPKGYTALHICSEYNQYDIAKYILENGGKFDIEDNYGNQPLHLAVFNYKGHDERLDIIRLFLDNGANVKHCNKAGKSPMDFAIRVKSKLIPLLKQYT